MADLDRSCDGFPWLHFVCGIPELRHSVAQNQKFYHLTVAKLTHHGRSKMSVEDWISIF